MDPCLPIIRTSIRMLSTIRGYILGGHASYGLGRLKVVSFVRRLAGLREASLESEFYEEFRRLGGYLDLTVITDDVAEEPEEFNAYRVPAVRIKRLYGLVKILAYCWGVWRLRRGLDLIYLRTFSPPESIATWFGRRVLGIRSMVLLPGTWLFEPPTLKNRVWRWLLSRTIKTSDILVLYSPLMLPDILRYFPDLDEGKVRYVHNGVDVERFSPGPPRREVLERLGVGGGERVVLYVGRISFRKGVDDLVRAFRVALDFAGDSVLVLAGGWEEGFGRRVRNVVEEFRLRDRVRFLGPVPNQDIPDLMRASKVFAYASRGGEGIPRAILEAMASGLPVAATKVAGVPEAVRDGETGFLVDVGDWRGLGERIGRLLADEPLRTRMGEAARRLVEREFSYDVVIPRLVEILKEAAGTSNSY